MSSFTINVALLSLLSAQALAQPHANYPWKPAHAHGALHRRHHAHGTGYQSGNFTANSTGLFPYSDITKAATSTLSATISPVAANSEVVSDSCATEGQTVTETATNVVTVTITPGGSSSSVSVAAPASPSSSSSASTSASTSEETSVSAAVSTSTEQKASMYTGPKTAESSAESPVASSSSSESEAPVFAPTSSSTAEAATSSTEASSSSAAPTTSSVAAAPSSYSASSSSSSSAPAESSSAPGTKRGVAYNDASLTTPFENYAPWGWNWETNPKGLDTSKFEYIPTCKDSTSYWTGLFAQAVESLKPKTIFTFNEPDNAGQANMDVNTCVSDFGTYITPHAGGDIEIVAPAVTNSGSPNEGLDYLDQFLGACDDCQIDAINLHWYDSYENAQGFIDYIGNASATLGKKYPHFAGARSDGTFTTYITEYGFTDGQQHDDGQYHPATDEQQASSLQTVLPYLDAMPFVKRYSYFMVSDGLMVNGDSVSQSGGVFQKYSGTYSG